ncbi:hypothetical protein GW17_00050181 [Ensete ventricosum]|uniref:Uncharacterized protein n=1 Tax=Ensete ventricosum TaxID=4639 RepID=A0A426YKJ6_ENSVE|nr:hypothetical protein B296_00049339 [Ensete ventricosum]RWV87788.1 hypothetical protein GW17_00050181 [Ensete ventricosum]RZS23108.1 hypothetical protein BHM03_00055970 [Ensete ventricosum]
MRHSHCVSSSKHVPSGNGNGKGFSSLSLCYCSLTGHIIKQTTVSFLTRPVLLSPSPSFCSCLPPSMAALFPGSRNNNKSTDKLEADAISCSSAAVTGSGGDNTTYVHADPANFRALVQRLTGPAGNYSSVHKLPVASPAAAPTVGSKRQKLQERRRASTKLEIDIGHSLYRTSTTTRCYRPHHHHCSNTTVSWRNGDEVGLLLSPISTIDSCLLASSASPTTATKGEEEERAIAEKGFYLHPSPGSNNGDPPKLLPLFPLHSPKNYSVSSSE